MSKLVNLTMFRGYVNKVLPTVYDDSLSYYEVLAKVMEKINEIINLDNAQNEIINNIPEDVSEFAEDLAQFKSTMTQQFNDFKTEINADFDAFEAEVNAKIAADSTPTQGSTKLVTSGGVYASLQDIINSLVKDARPTEDSTNYVTSGGVWKAINDAVEDLEATLDTKQNALTWDTTPTANSTNPVQSGGIKYYVDNAAQAVQNNLDSYITTNNSRVSGIEGDITDLETGKQDTLTFDLAPTLGSNNPVTSNGIAQAIAGVTPSIEVDPEPTQGSTNPVSSNGVYVAVSDLETELEEGLADKQDALTFDVLPTQNSLNPVTSGGVWTAIAQVDPTGTIDPTPTQGSTAAVSSGGTWTALQTLNNDLTAAIDTKQDILTFDSVPTEDSENPVYSGGVFAELELKADKSETQQYPISDIVSSNDISVADSAEGYVQGLKIYGKSHISKNLLIPTATLPTTIQDVRWSLNDDGTVSATRISTGVNVSDLTWGNCTLTAGSYTVDAFIPGGSSTSYRCGVVANGNTTWVTNKYDLTLTEETEITIKLRIYPEYNADNVIFSPLICTASAYETDPTFEPYGIISIGDSGSLTITTANSDSSESTTATLTTGLPYCGIPVNSGETYTDEQGQKWVADTASVEGVVKRCRVVVINSTASFTAPSGASVNNSFRFKSSGLLTSNPARASETSYVIPDIMCNALPAASSAAIANGTTGISTSLDGTEIYLRIPNVSTNAELTAYLASNPLTLVYILATPTTQEITPAEKSALLNLKTFDSTSSLSITDSPYVDFAYLKNTENGEAIAQLEDKMNVALGNKQDTLTFDDTPTVNSTNPVASGGVYTALTGKQDTLTWDNAPTEDSDNAISSGAVYTALQGAGGMQRTLLYTNTTPLVLPATITFGSDIRAYDVLQIEYTRFDAAVNNTITPQYIEIPVDSLNTYYTDYVGIYLVGVMLPGIDTENVFYEINGLFTELTYDQTRSTLPTDITLNINRIFGVNYS